MPIEIRELIIKATVGSGNGGSAANESSNSSGQNEQEMVQKCVEKVLAIIKEKAER